MFSDIRGFTTISEKLPPQKLTALLNEYLTPMTDLVFKHEGTLDKYIGDAIMAVYGAPLDLPEHALAASRTALEMMEELRKLQIKWREQGYPDIDIGIGLNTGIMSVGNMGSKQRFEYTAIGDNVNLSSRLEGINKDYGTHIVISENTYGVVKDKVVVRELDAVRVKGKKAPVHIYELLGLQPATEEQRDQVERFMRGLQMYREQKWDEAAAVFNGMVEKWPDDKPAKLYVERCKEMKAAPPGPDWDGVFVMTHK
jgi:adenylate cyclase